MLRAAIARSPSSARMSLAPLSIGKSNRAAMSRRERCCSIESLIVDSPIIVWVPVQQRYYIGQVPQFPERGLAVASPGRYWGIELDYRQYERTTCRSRGRRQKGQRRTAGEYSYR